MSSVDVLEAIAPTTPEALPQDDLIFDIGMNICEDTSFYLRKGFRVVAVDANPSSCANAAEQFAREIAEGRLIVLNRAISDSREPLRFFACRTQSAFSTASEALRDKWIQVRGAEFDEIDVPAVTSADLIEEYGVPYYAKVDIEGYDLVCLRGFLSAHARPKYLSAEVDFYRLDELLAILPALGYRRFALVGQSSVPDQRPPDPPREGRYADRKFHGGCSGLFGRELPVPWVDAAGLGAQCRAVVRHYRMAGALRRLAGVPLVGPAISEFRDRRFPLARTWYDIHATV